MADRFLLLVNPSAGAGRALKRLPAIESAMRDRGLDYRLVMTTGIEQGCADALAGAAAGEIPVVVSGDGLVGRVGGALAGGDVPLGVIPGGRGNDLARVVGISDDPAKAVSVLAAGHRRRIDVGEANGQRFLCIASCGFDSDANRIANEARLVKGPIVYLYAALRALWQWKAAGFELLLDGRPERLRGYSVGVCNSKAYGGGMFVAPDAQLDDGLFDVVAKSEQSKLRFLLNIRNVFDGSHLEEPEVSLWRARSVEIRADRPFAVYADGERLTDLPARISVLEDALELIAPPS